MKRALVIGSGASGLPSIKSCLEEGLDVVCYEVAENLGGVWRYKEKVEESTTSVFSSVCLNINKEMMAYTDYPPPLHFPTYPRHFQWLEYLESYAEHFGLKKCIKFQHKVQSVEKATDYEVTGRWKVEVSDLGNNGQVSVEYFDFVMVCSGHHVYPNVPHIPGQDDFTGKIIHTKVYRKAEDFRDMKVLVVGFGNSAVDIANDICSATRQTYLSTRRKGWIIPRVLGGRKLTINELYRRSFALPYKFLPSSWLISKEESLCNQVFDHDWINVRPAHRISAQRPVINDFLPMNLVTGSVILKPDIKELRKDGVMFVGEERVTEVDVVILGTGFKPIFPFLKGMENAGEYLDTIYRLVIPATLSHHTLVFVGLLDADYSIPVCAEMQSRWAARVFTGHIKLPEQKKMIEEAKQFQENLIKSSYQGFSQKTQIHAPPYINKLASELGVKPNLLKLFFTDFQFFLGLFYGALNPYQFRIQGPHSWKGARQAVLDAEQRDIYQFTKSDKRQVTKESALRKPTLLALGLFFGSILFYRLNKDNFISIHLANSRLNSIVRAIAQK